MRITRFGHATLLIETDITRLIIDPGVYSTEWHDLRDLDAVLITHEHHDHFDAEHVDDLVSHNAKARISAPSSVINLLEEADSRTDSIASGSMLEIGDVLVEVVGGEHAKVHDLIPRIANVGVVLSVGGGPRLFHPGDAFDVVPRDIDMLALPLSAPWATAGTTADFLRAVSPRVAFPIHDAGVSPTGHATYMRIVGGLTPDRCELRAISQRESLEV